MELEAFVDSRGRSSQTSASMISTAHLQPNDQDRRQAVENSSSSKSQPALFLGFQELVLILGTMSHQILSPKLAFLPQYTHVGLLLTLQVFEKFYTLENILLCTDEGCYGRAKHYSHCNL